MNISFNDGGLRKRLQRVAKNKRPELVRSIGRIANEVENRSAKEVPVDTGTLKRSLGRDVGQGGLEVIVKPNAKYAVPVHEGVSFRRRLKNGNRSRTIRKGNPFMVRGRRQAQPFANREIREFFRKIYR